MEELIDKARVLIEALPYISQFRGRTVVVKVGGRALAEPQLLERFAQDVILLTWVGIRVVVVHGGGRQVSDMLERLGIEPRFVDGLRVTDDAVLAVVEMVLGGVMNQEIVQAVNRLGGRAVGLTGKDGGLVLATRVKGTGGVDLGHVGEVVAVEPKILDELVEDFIPIVAPLALDADGQALNVNADPFAARLAAALGAEKLVLLTDVPGVQGPDGALLTTLRAAEATAMIERGEISGGMIPKVQNALDALANGVGKVHIIDGRLEHALLLEIFTAAGVGTQVLAGQLGS